MALWRGLRQPIQRAQASHNWQKVQQGLLLLTVLICLPRLGRKTGAGKMLPSTRRSRTAPGKRPRRWLGPPRPSRRPFTEAPEIPATKVGGGRTAPCSHREALLPLVGAEELPGMSEPIEYTSHLRPWGRRGTLKMSTHSHNESRRKKPWLLAVWWGYSWAMAIRVAPSWRIIEDLTTTFSKTSARKSSVDESQALRRSMKDSKEIEAYNFASTASHHIGWY